MPIRDLSQTLVDGMHVYPGDPPLAIAHHRAFDADGFNVSAISLGSHTGTHLDVPRHFLRDGAPVDAVPLDRFVGPALVVRVPHVPGEPLRIPDEAYAALRPGDILLVSTGWEREAGTARYFKNYPRFSADAPDRLVAAGIKALGVDLPSVKSEGPSRAMHLRLLSAGIAIVEGLVGMEAIENAHVMFHAAPLKIAGGDGSPVRAYVVDGES